ncbi:DEAD/DEAH box helicase [Phycisphaera mikurensis]|uniref:DEAD/DEAH box helicase n=1 Tax=Phycisphaera mikurensis TaxID=547188 RepID=UPI0036F39DF6
MLAGLERIGYEQPSPIQAAIIPAVLSGVDVIGQAQTGTGKTAAFALPILSKLQGVPAGGGSVRFEAPAAPTALVLAPTRELAIQVAEAFQTYAQKMPGFHVVPVYGGADYTTQLRAFSRGVHVVVGTPGRVLDHMKRGTLNVQHLQHLVLDEADEMLRMGFIEDVEYVLDEIPDAAQVALFSATMPAQIKRIAQSKLKDPQHIRTAGKTKTAETVRQRYAYVPGRRKINALTRVLDAEPHEAVLVFVRTRNACTEVADQLQARGHAAEALSGEVPQRQRERIVESLKDGRIDVVVATDVAARGLDVERVGHVINYDMPTDPEAYIHRIGRTGRAGRSGEAILFVTPREKRMLGELERITGQAIEEMQPPSDKDIRDLRVSRFLAAVDAQPEEQPEAVAFFRGLLEKRAAEQDLDPLDLAANLAALAQGDRPIVGAATPDGEDEPPRRPRVQGEREQPKGRFVAPPPASREGFSRTQRGEKPRGDGREVPEGFERYRLDVGRDDGAGPSNFVGAITGETGLTGGDIGRIALHDAYATVDLPAGMPPQVFALLKKLEVMGKPLNLVKMEGGGHAHHAGGGGSGRAPSHGGFAHPKKKFGGKPGFGGPKKAGAKRFAGGKKFGGKKS